MPSQIDPDDLVMHYNFVSETLLQLVVLKKVIPSATTTPLTPILIQVWQFTNGSWVKISEHEPPTQSS